jgi:dipeptidyl aminopeptidase/acylaminoacyl peptidase
VDVASGRDRKLLASSYAEYYLAQGITHPPRPWSPDGRYLAFTSNEKDTMDIGLLDVGRDKVSWLVVDGNEKFAPTWSPDGQHLAFLRLEEGNLRLYAVRPGGKPVPFSPEKGMVASFAWSPGGEALLYTYSRADDPGALFVTTLRGRRRAVVRSARPGLPRMDLVPPCHVRYPSHDRRIPALLYLPRRRNGAGIVIPHGGPEASQLNEWYPEVQLFASRGYVVIAPNYRGSTGYGRGFRKLSDRDLGGGDLRDVVNAARHLEAEGLASPDRIGIWGHSYGGFMALHALTQAPEVWRVGVSAMGFFNWKTAIEAERGYLQVYDRQKMGNPEDDPEFFRSRSPYFHLNNLRAPLLMFAGRQDPRCPVTEARQVRDKLQALGRKVEYVEYADEGHWPRKLDNEVDLLQRSLDFVLEHLPPEA